MVMTYGDLCHTVSYLLLNVLFGGLPGWVGADVDGTRLALAIVWYPVDRLEEAEGETLLLYRSLISVKKQFWDHSRHQRSGLRTVSGNVGFCGKYHKI